MNLARIFAGEFAREDRRRRHAAERRNADLRAFETRQAHVHSWAYAGRGGQFHWTSQTTGWREPSCTCGSRRTENWSWIDGEWRLLNP